MNYRTAVPVEGAQPRFFTRGIRQQQWGVS
jgi:hypothetical protein